MRIDQLAERLHEYAVDLRGKGGPLDDDVRPDLLEAAALLEQYAALLAENKRTRHYQSALFEVSSVVRKAFREGSP